MEFGVVRDEAVVVHGEVAPLLFPEFLS